MLPDSSIRKSLEDYVKLRIKDISSEINQTFPNVKQIWKCENQVDFLYGYYVGKIEEGTLHYLLKATRTAANTFDVFEIRGIIETYREDLKNSIERALS
jgi:hypothetical protein